MIDGKKSVVRKRIAIETPDLKSQGSYFTDPKPDIQFVTSGCTVLDCALGGGWALGRVANIVGDKSTAKTALAGEAMINFTKQFPDGFAAYRDAEAAFDKGYAAAMGLPLKKIDFGKQRLATVEDFSRDIVKFADTVKEKRGIYVLDSLDALSDEAEMSREIGEATYGANKARKLSEMFRKVTDRVEASKTLLMIVSQVRDNIGAMFGEKSKRSGGRALDFYSSQTLWLYHKGYLKRTINKVERPVGISIKAQVKKNKVGLPFREVEFDFIFGYGIDELDASIQWLSAVGKLKEIDLTEPHIKEYLKETAKLSDADYKKECDRAAGAVKKVWAEVEQTFLPRRSKYGV
jgi:recombination protein RecA